MAEETTGQTVSDTTSDATRGQKARLSSGATLSLSGFGLLIIFMIQNTDEVTLTFLFWSFTWPLWLFTLVTATVGSIIWIGLGIVRRHRRRVARREARRY